MIGFVIDVGKFEWQSVVLVSSIRKFEVQPKSPVYAFIPEDCVGLINEEVIDFHRRNDVRIVEIPSHSEVFTPDYRHGHKILAALAMPEAPVALLLDTDTVFIRPFWIGHVLKRARLAARPAPGSPWKGRYSDKWAPVFDALDLEIQPGQQPIYMNAGVIFFDNTRPLFDGQAESFPEAWMRSALQLDRVLPVAQSRPWLDQVALCALATSLPKGDLRVLRRNWNATKLIRANGIEADPFVLHYHGDHSPNRMKQMLGLERFQSLMEFGAGSMPRAQFATIVESSADNHLGVSVGYRKQLSDVRERTLWERARRFLRRQ